MKIVEWVKDARKVTKLGAEFDKENRKYVKKYFPALYKEQRKNALKAGGICLAIIGVIWGAYLGFVKFIDWVSDKITDYRNKKEVDEILNEE